MLKELIEGKRVIVFGDNDRSGRDGAEEFAKSVFPYASEVSLSFPDGEVTESNGRDVRDQMNDNSQKGISPKETLQKLIDQAVPFQPVEDQPAQDETDDSEEDEAGDDDNQTEYKPFPVHCFPSVMRDYTIAGSESLKSDLSLVALPLLVMIASMIGAARVLMPNGDWRVPATLWGVAIANSGSMKTPASAMATWPLYKLQAKAHIRNVEKLEEYDKRKAIYEIRMKEYLRDVAKGEGQPPDEPEKPDEPRIIDKVAGDVTIERLMCMLNDNPKGVPVIKDELAGLIGNLNKYNGAKGADESVYLEGYNLGQAQVARKGDRKDLLITNTSICIYGTTQPDIYRRTMSGSYRESGFMWRFLEVYPPRTAKQFPGKGIPDDIKDALMRVVELLDGLQPDESEPGVFNPIPVYPSAEAMAEYKKFHRWHNTEAITMNGDLASKWSKLEELPLRLSLIFHYVENITESRIPDRVSAETMLNAIELTEWFKNEAKRIRRLFGSEDGIEETPQQKQQKRLIRFVRRKGGSVKPRDVQRGLRGFDTSADAEAVLNELVKDGVGEWVNIETNKEGMPSRVFQLFTKSTRRQPTTCHKTNSVSGGVVDAIDRNDDSQPIPEPFLSTEHAEDAVPEDLSGFMDLLD